MSRQYFCCHYFQPHSTLSTELAQAGSDGGQILPRVDPPPSQLDRLQSQVEVSDQQLRLRLSRLPADHGTAQGPESHPCRGERRRWLLKNIQTLMIKRLLYHLMYFSLTNCVILKPLPPHNLLREAPTKMSPLLFGHCPFGRRGLNPCQDGLGHLSPSKR